MAKLHELDDVAFVRFASVYRRFQDVNDFMKELKDLLNKRSRPAEG
jgi:transcriptional repressor NrdR